MFEPVQIREKPPLFGNAPMPELMVPPSREPGLLFLHIPNFRLNDRWPLFSFGVDCTRFWLRCLNTLQMFESNFTLLVKMKVTVSACHTENSVLFIIGNRSYVPVLFHGYFFSASQLDIVVIKLDFSTESLRYYNRVCTLTLYSTFNFPVMISFIDNFLCQVKSVVLLGLDSRDLLSNCFFTIASFDCVTWDSINNILHELSPFHHTVSIDIDFLEKFVTTVHQLILFVIILTKNRIKHELYKVFVVDSIFKLVPVILETFQPLFAHKEHDLFWQERKLHNFRLWSTFLFVLLQRHQTYLAILFVIIFLDFDGVLRGLRLIRFIKKRIIFFVLISFVRGVIWRCVHHVRVCGIDVKCVLPNLTVIHFIQS